MLKKESVLFNFTPDTGMKISKGDIAYTLRSEMHGHLPCVIAFEPGIASRCGGHIYQDKAGTLRSNAGDNQQAVVIGAIDDTYRKQSN